MARKKAVEAVNENEEGAEDESESENGSRKVSPQSLALLRVLRNSDGPIEAKVVMEGAGKKYVRKTLKALSDRGFVRMSFTEGRKRGFELTNEGAAAIAESEAQPIAKQGEESEQREAEAAAV